MISEQKGRMVYAVKVTAPVTENGRWAGVRTMTDRQGPMSGVNFLDRLENAGFQQSGGHLAILQRIPILIVGAGGLGCELLKNIALLGFVDIHLLDMDTIDESNLNRQFLFTNDDIGKSKAEVAAAYVNKRVDGVKVTPHFCRLESKERSFYSQFPMVLSGLDSVEARRALNSILCSSLRYVVKNSDGLMELDRSSCQVIVDGGTEGLHGNVRIIQTGLSACVECQLDLYPPQRNFPLCTIANVPRQPAHCIEWAKVIAWEKEKPFGDEAPDGDNPDHLEWLYRKALAHAEKFKIQGVTLRETQGVVKHIIPAVASTNAAVAAMMATEAFKVAVNDLYPVLDNFLNFNQAAESGAFVYSTQLERNPNCVVCDTSVKRVQFSSKRTLGELLNLLVDAKKNYRLKQPGISAFDPSTGKLAIIYSQNVADTVDNLGRTVHELGLARDQMFIVTDPTLSIDGKKFMLVPED